MPQERIYPFPSFIAEKHLINNYLLIFTHECPVLIRAQIEQLIKTQNEDWFLNCLKDRDVYPSNRKVYLPSNLPVIIKAKNVREQPNPDQPHIEFCSRSLVHEVRTTTALQAIINHNQLPLIVIYEDQEYQLNWQTQKPYGAIVDLNDQSKRYGIFEYIPYTSARDETTDIGWNFLPASKRKLFAQFHNYLNLLARTALKEGLEPWDLGVHQIIYQINEETRQINIWIIDTEEFSVTEQFGNTWPLSIEETVLAPVLLYL